MANIYAELQKKLENGEITLTGGAKIAPAFKGTVQVKTADWGANRDNTVEQGKIICEVKTVTDGPADAVGSVITEYVSLKNEKMAQIKYLQIAKWLVDAGVKEEKFTDDDDETLADAMRTIVHALDKYAKRRDIVVPCTRKETDKKDQNGRPYYSNYFDAAPENAAVSPEEVFGKDEKPAKGKKSEEDDDVKSDSPFKSKHAAKDDD